MRLWMAIAICLMLYGCHDRNSNARTYVISQSHSDLEVQEELSDPSVSLLDNVD